MTVCVCVHVYRGVGSRQVQFGPPVREGAVP